MSSQAAKTLWTFRSQIKPRGVSLVRLNRMKGIGMAPPYINATGLVTKIFDKIIEAQQPERFTQDFLGTKLGFASGSARPIIPLMKKLGFIGSDGTPTQIYSQFRNPDTRGAAMAQALRSGYKDFFERNEFCYDLSKDKLRNLVVEMTGASPDDAVVRAILNTFLNLRAYARFDEKIPEARVPDKLERQAEDPRIHGEGVSERLNGGGLNLSYTINLNLPETSDVEVFNAIFRSLKEHLLKR